MSRNDIGLADLIMAFAVLQPKDEESKAAIAEMLGFEIKEQDSTLGESQ